MLMLGWLDVCVRWIVLCKLIVASFPLSRDCAIARLCWCFYYFFLFPSFCCFLASLFYSTFKGRQASILIYGAQLVYVFLGKPRRGSFLEQRKKLCKIFPVCFLGDCSTVIHVCCNDCCTRIGPFSNPHLSVVSVIFPSARGEKKFRVYVATNNGGWYTCKHKRKTKPPQNQWAPFFMETRKRLKFWNII